MKYLFASLAIFYLMLACVALTRKPGEVEAYYRGAGTLLGEGPGLRGHLVCARLRSPGGIQMTHSPERNHEQCVAYLIHLWQSGVQQSLIVDTPEWHRIMTFRLTPQDQHLGLQIAVTEAGAYFFQTFKTSDGRIGAQWLSHPGGEKGYEILTQPHRDPKPRQSRFRSFINRLFKGKS